MAGIQSAVWAASLSATLTWSPLSGEDGVGKHSSLRGWSPHHTHLLWSSTSACRQSGTVWNPSGYIQKWVVQRDRRGRVRAAGKPSDEPLRKGETQSPTNFECHITEATATHITAPDARLICCSKFGLVALNQLMAHGHHECC